MDVITHTPLARRNMRKAIALQSPSATARRLVFDQACEAVRAKERRAVPAVIGSTLFLKRPVSIP